jgi:hypothetical protein
VRSRVNHEDDAMTTTFPSRYVWKYFISPHHLDGPGLWRSMKKLLGFGLALDPSQHDVFTVMKATLPLP